MDILKQMQTTEKYQHNHSRIMVVARVNVKHILHLGRGRKGTKEITVEAKPFCASKLLLQYGTV